MKKKPILCVVHVSSFCVLSMFHHSVCCPCYIILCVVHVTSFCVLSMLHHFVCCPCYIILCVVHVTSFCVLSMLHHSVCCPCYIILCVVHVTSFCVLSMLQLPNRSIITFPSELMEPSGQMTLRAIFKGMIDRFYMNVTLFNWLIPIWWVDFYIIYGLYISSVHIL